MLYALAIENVKLGQSLWEKSNMTIAYNSLKMVSSVEY